MRICTNSLLVALVALTACSTPEFAIQAGYAQLSLDGDVGYLDGSTTVATEQTLDSAFGLGDDQGSPYGRLELDTGVLHWSVSGFAFEDEGVGTLTADFGANLTAGVDVHSSFDLTNAKAAMAFDIDMGPVSIAPGLAVDYIDLNMVAEDSPGVYHEEVDLQAPIPMLFLRAELDFDWVALVAEGGYVAVDVEDVDAKMLDLEAQLVVRPWSALELFAGYRSIAIEAEGLIDDDSVDIDLTLSGFVLGCGLRF